MAESEDGLGTVKILLEQVLEEVLYLKKILATPKEEELKLVDVHAPVLWYAVSYTHLTLPTIYSV